MLIFSHQYEICAHFEVFLQRKGRQFWANWVFQNLTPECLVFEAELGLDSSWLERYKEGVGHLFGRESYCGVLGAFWCPGVPLCTQAKSLAACSGLPCLLRLGGTGAGHPSPFCIVFMVLFVTVLIELGSLQEWFSVFPQQP